MTDAQDTQWLDEILNTLVTEVLFPSTKLDPKLPYVERAKAAILAHEAEAVAAGKLEVMKSDYEDIYHIHMAHDWNEMSDDTREWLMKRLHNIHRLQREQEGK